MIGLVTLNRRKHWLFVVKQDNERKGMERTGLERIGYQQI
jgi:hypothetical protein